jgi:hypothetical protein
MVHTDPRALGRHRKFKHGVIGAKHFRKDGTPRKGKEALPPGTAAALQCPECGLQLTDGRSYGYHRRMKHGIPGKTAKYNDPAIVAARRAAKQQKAGTAIVHVEPAAPTNGHSNGKGRPPMMRSPNGFPLQFIGHVVGYLEARCHQEAYDNGLPAKAFTRDVAEYFLAKTQMGEVMQPPTV